MDAKKITEILKDKYHKGLTVKELRTKHKISQKVWSEINKKFGKMFVEKFGKKKPQIIKVSADDLENLWDNELVVSSYK